ncbi:MAG: SDR family oxidoreductase [Saprospiraceae bacterium]|nr:SDR family oxidoreductase [Saprospiraceae bacterium]
MAGFFYHKRIWITGASSGIGESLAIALARQGAHLILSSRNALELERVAAACKEAGAPETIVQPLDLEQYIELPGIADQLIRKVGKIDVLINNGGISQRARALDTTLDVDKKLMDVNYMGTVALTKAVLPHMLLHELGHIVVVSSLVGIIGSPLRSSYSAAKHALHGFFDSLRAELAETPIRVTIICPGFIRTNVSKNALTGAGKPQGKMDEATGKGMHPDVVARKILRAVENGREEAYFGGREVLAIYLKRFFPGWFSRILRRAKVT